MRIVKVVLIVLLVLGLAAATTLYFFDSIAQTAIERGATRATGQPTEVGDTDVQLRAGRLELNQLTIANPAGFDAPTLLDLQSLGVELKLCSLLDETVVVPRLAIQGLTLNLERSGGRNNIDPLLEHIRGEERQPTEEPRREKRYIVSELLIEGVSANVQAEVAGQTAASQVQLPAITLSEVGAEEGGVPMGRLVTIILAEILRQAAENTQLPAHFRDQIQSAMTVQEETKARAQRQLEEQKEKILERARELLPR